MAEEQLVVTFVHGNDCVPRMSRCVHARVREWLGWLGDKQKQEGWLAAGWLAGSLGCLGAVFCQHHLGFQMGGSLRAYSMCRM